MKWVMDAMELMLLNQKTKAELIQIIKDVNEKNKEASEKYSEMYKSKRESDKLHKEDVGRYKTQMESYIKEIVILEETNKMLSHKVDIKLGNVYNVNWNWVDKIVFILKRANRSMRSADIMEVLYKNDIEFRTWADPQKSLSPHLTKALKYGRIIGEKQKGQNGYLYSLPKHHGNNQEG